MGCGWLHAARENDWTRRAEARGLAIDRAPAPWHRAAVTTNFPAPDQDAFAAAYGRFEDQLERHGLASRRGAPDRPAADLLTPGDRWNPLLDAVSTWVSGAALQDISADDLANYHETGDDWRLPGGYGALVAAEAEGLEVALACPVRLIDRSGEKLRLETPRGDLTARAVIVTVPTSVLVQGGLRFRPELPETLEAAAKLPLGFDDKVFVRLDRPEDFPPEARLIGAPDRTATASYHLRPFGRPLIEAYFGGALARDLEAGGAAAFLAFVREELAAVYGAAIRERLHLVAATAWGRDLYARGSYSYAKPGAASARRTLARSADPRVLFAGEACSVNDFSTAHGALRTGIAAAQAVRELLGS
jgi:monoamine oxidase